MARDQSDREAALSRIRAQLPIDSKLAYADEVIENSGSLDNLHLQVDQLVAKLNRQVGWTFVLSCFPPIGILSALFTLTKRFLFRRRLRI